MPAAPIELPVFYLELLQTTRAQLQASLASGMSRLLVTLCFCTTLVASAFHVSSLRGPLGRDLVPLRAAPVVMCDARTPSKISSSTAQEDDSTELDRI